MKPVKVTIELEVDPQRVEEPGEHNQWLSAIRDILRYSDDKWDFADFRILKIMHQK